MKLTMRNWFAFACMLMLAVLLTGCFEDEVDVTLNPDGSGKVRQRMKLSAEMVQQMSQGGAQGPDFPASRQEVEEEFGGVIKVTSFKAQDTPDGGKEIMFEGTFDSAEEFFNSDYAAEGPRLSMETDDGNIVIRCSLQQEGDMQMSLDQTYEMARGAHVRRTVHFPAPVDETNGELSHNGRSVTWAVDLRDDAGLAKSKKFIEGDAKGLGRVVISRQAMESASEPSAPAKTAETGADAQPQRPSADPSEFDVEIVDLDIERRTTGPAGAAALPRSIITLKLTWPGEKRAVRCSAPVLTGLRDRYGNSLLTRAPRSAVEYDLRGRGGMILLKAEALAPKHRAGSLKELAGYVDVVTDVATETVELRNEPGLVGKPTGNAALDQLGIRLLSVEEEEVTLSLDADRDRLVSLRMRDADGAIVEPQGWFGTPDRITFQFWKDAAGAQAFLVTVVTDEQTARIEFKADSLKLP